MEKHGASEKDFKQWLMVRMKAINWFQQSIETSTGNGVPDLYVQAPHCRSVWLELKVGEIDCPLIRKEQRLWGMKHQKAGGLSYFLYYRRDQGRCYLYANPVKVVSVIGKYLSIQDGYVDSCDVDMTLSMIYSKIVF